MAGFTKKFFLGCTLISLIAQDENRIHRDSSYRTVFNMVDDENSGTVRVSEVYGASLAQDLGIAVTTKDLESAMTTNDESDLSLILVGNF